MREPALAFSKNSAGDIFSLLCIPKELAGVCLHQPPHCGLDAISSGETDSRPHEKSPLRGPGPVFSRDDKITPWGSYSSYYSFRIYYAYFDYTRPLRIRLRG